MTIDGGFRSTWRVVGRHGGHDIWSPLDGKDEIHGTRVGVHWASCIGCMRCVPVCPLNVLEGLEADGRLVVDPVRDDECILCYACEMVCPVTAIHVMRSGGSTETMDALLGEEPQP